MRAEGARAGVGATVVPQNMSLLRTSMEEVVELKAHLQSPSHVTHTSRETSTRQSTHRPRTHQKMLGSISACEVYLVKVEGGGERGGEGEGQG